MIKRSANATYRLARRLAIAIVGCTVLLIGVIMLVTPGPAIVVIPVGLAILSIEFAWARSWLKRLREKISGHQADGHAQRAQQHRDRVH
jgi:tellurite resistance protein TerC